MGKTLTIFFLLFLSLPYILMAQFRPQQGGMVDERERENTTSEAIKVESRINVWNLTGNGAFLKKEELDTLQEDFYIYNPIYKNAITNTFTGNYGGAYLNNDFFARDYNNDFYFLHTHDAYLLTPGNIQYYNTTTPYTLLDYSQSEKQSDQNETRFNVLHSQNINDKLNFTFRFDQAKSEGQYDQQDSKNHSVSLYSSYKSDQLNIHGGYISNGITNSENGGMVSDNELLNPETKGLYPIYLSDVSSEYKSNYLFATAEYRIGKYIKTKDNDEAFKPLLGFIYSVEVAKNLRQFREKLVNYDFFPNVYIDSLATNDSVRLNRLTNIFQIKQYETAEKKASFGKRAFIGVDIVRTTHPSLYYNMASTRKYTNLYVGGGIFRNEGEFWKWNAEGKLFITGYRSGQTELSASIWKPVKFLKDSAASIKIDGRLETVVPDYFQQKYGGNHIRWDNRFNNEQRLTAGFTFESPERKFKVGANYALINNFIYNDTLGMPAQTKKELLILSFFLNKDFVLRNFHIKARVLAQKASLEDFIHLPELSVHLSVYYKMLISKVLYTQIGVDTRYNTAYFADAYEPSTGLFYLQNEKRIGDYPYIDAYASLKLKRTRVFLKYINIGSGFLNKEYFTALHYPMNAMTFRLGVAWTFYD
ncbi:MAG: putative porin [Chlorobi bacterium]|nr:putative porin [Chlorobiota bacterium]